MMEEEDSFLFLGQCFVVCGERLLVEYVEQSMFKRMGISDY